jgi:hypothetical protein
MLELCLGSQPFRSPEAFDTDTVAKFRTGIATLGYAVTTLGFWGNVEREGHSAQFGFTMSALHSRAGNGESRKMDAPDMSSRSYLESTLATNRGRGLTKAITLLRAQPDPTPAESYSCTHNQINSFGLIFLQKKWGYPWPEMIL